MAKKSIDALTILKALTRLKKTFRPPAEFFAKWNNLRGLLYKTREYRIFTAEVRARACGKCARCPARGREVHHKVRVYDDPMKALDVSNGELLCSKCHKKEHKPARSAARAQISPREARRTKLAHHRTAQRAVKLASHKSLRSAQNSP